MEIHEYQAKRLFKQYGLPVLKGEIAYSAKEALTAAGALSGNVFAVKAQIHAGGRGKGGGVKIAKSKEEIKEYANQIIGMQLVTPQTGPQGKKVHLAYIEEGCDIEKELYLSFLVDRETNSIVIIASLDGGVDIEDVAEKKPERIARVHIDPLCGIQAFHLVKINKLLGFSKELSKAFSQILKRMYHLFTELDASLIEVNPLVITKQGRFVLLDGKVSFDGNALFRHPEILELRDMNEEDPSEFEASKHDLSYIKLDGSIGCMVNGAGLAMATMDIIKLHGGEPANFLDVGGGASKEKVKEAFKIILSDPNVKGIFVNIFGGIMRCDIIAEGIIAGAKELDLSVPLVVRLQGTNVDLGKEILNNSGLKIITADTLSEAAQKIVDAT